MTTSPTDWGACEIARRIALKEISSREVVQAHIARIEEVDGRLNAVVIRRFEQAHEEARAADERQAGGEPLGRLHGVPTTVKESFFLARTEATVGVTNRKGIVSPDDGWAVRLMKEAGAVIVGKTNVPQLMIWHECDNPVYGCTNNPWDLSRTPGGSTGGEGAIIAARGSPLGLGNDLGGSIRVPAHFCGIHGIKPTSHRFSNAGTVRTMRGFEAIVTQPGPMARRVEDLWLALHVLDSSQDELTRGHARPHPLPDPAQIDLRGLTVGVLVHDGLLPASAAIVRAVREAADALRLRGAKLVDLDASTSAGPFGQPDFFDIYCGLIGADGGADAKRISQGSVRDWRVSRMAWIAGLGRLSRLSLAAGLRSAGQKWQARLVAAAGRKSADEYWQLSRLRQEMAASAFEACRSLEIDAILCPPHALPAMRHGTGLDLIAAASDSMLFNLLGWPAGVVAATRVRAGEEATRQPSRDHVERCALATDRGSVGLPVGVQVAAPPWREDVVLAVMAFLEQYFGARDDYPGRPSVPA
jgi:fatty acid amide hydrolase